MRSAASRRLAPLRSLSPVLGGHVGGERMRILLKLLLSASTAGVACLLLSGPAGAAGGRFARVGAARLFYEQAGKGPDVVLIHGFTLDRRMWDPQVPALAKHFRVTRYDVRGFGQSIPLTGPHDPTEDLRSLLDQLAIRQTCIVGMSMGGRIAIDFALSQPKRVKCLVLIAADMSGFPHPTWGDRFGPMFEAGAKGDLARAKALWLRDRFVTPVKEDQAITAVVERLITECPCSQLANPALIPQAAVPPAFERLEALRVPTLAIVGDAEDPDMRAIADTIERRVTGARKLVIPGAGHLVNMEQSGVLNDAVIAFLRTRT